MILSIFEHSIDFRDAILDIIGSCEIVIPKTVLDELCTLSRKPKARSAIRYARKNFRIIDSKGDVDTSVIQLARELDGIVATNDRELRKKLREESIPVLFLRGKKKLEIDGVLGT
jgi:hypothetical protein